jgi:hypothetical protein
MRKKFKAEVLTGHKDAAVEVPFDPAEVWGLAPRPLWRGRRGHAVRGTVNGFKFAESYIVPRQKKFYLLLGRELSQAAGVNAGDHVTVALEPAAAPLP